MKTVCELQFKKHILHNLSFVISFVCFILSSAYSFSQSIQELESKLKSASAEDKPDILNQLSEAYLKSNQDKSVDYAEQAYNAAKKTNNINAQTEASINLGNGYAVEKNQQKAIVNYKEAIKVFDQYNQPASSAFVWNKIADSYIGAQKFTDAVDANTKALDLYKKANDKKGMVEMNIELGDIFLKQKKYESALPYYKQALAYADSKDAKMQITILNRIGTDYSNWGNYEEATVFITKALDVATKNNLTEQANAISKNLEVVKKNLSGWQQSQTGYAQKKEQETQEQIQSKENEISSLSADKMKSMEEIEQLNVEDQNKALKIKNQQEEIITKQLETEKQAKANELMKKEQELTDAQLNQQRWIIWGGIAFSILLLIFTFYVFQAYRNKRKANTILTQKNEVIYKQKEQIEQKNVLITDSIDYAKNIQDAILPPVSSITKFFPESFVLYKPKDIVSGDFFWTHETNNNIFIAAADCTGHGVPGAFMSLLGFIMLDDIVKRIENASPAEILNEVNFQLMATLHQDGENKTGKFGMDICLIKYNTLTKELIYSGAHNPLVIINNNQISELKADRISIGTTRTTSFNNQILQTKEGDMIYLFSDGYQDQIGGEKRKKFLAFHMKELFVQIHAKNMEQQKNELDSKHIEWRGTTDQTDDIIIIGLKV